MSFYFPLYEDLKTKITKYSLSEDQQNKLLELLKKNNSDENIYLLMRAYEQEKDSTVNPEKLPFEGKQLKSGPRFYFEKIPMEVKVILMTYLKLKEKK